ncbi:MFS transporter (plasmid) [Rhodococcus pyridinivorans]|nr:MFS transporter [Rhodococcus pyridinivorans]UTM39809.1 MFS transporter [Rhodococcus pyridinivorans]
MLSIVIFLVSNVFGSWALVFPITPLLVSTAGGTRFTAGATTGVFMAATIVAQLFTPVLLRHYDFRRVVASGCLLLGLPCLAMVPWSDNITTLMMISVVRGTGFGLVTVACSALPPYLVSKDRLSRAIAAQGMANAGSQTIFLLVGLQLYQSTGIVGVSALATTMASIAAVAVLGLPQRLYGRSGKQSGSAPTQGVLKRQFVLVNVAVVGIASAYGGLSALIPLVDYPQFPHAGVILAAIGGAVVAGRFAAGRYAHRTTDHRSASQIGVFAAAVGMMCLYVAALEVHAALAIALIGGVAFGFGLGWVQNVTLIRVFDSAPAHRVGLASAAWNISMDAGIGLGSTTMGAMADHSGYSSALLIATVAIVLTVALPLALQQSRKRQDRPTSREERASQL